MVPVHKVADFMRNDPKSFLKRYGFVKSCIIKKKKEKAKKLCKKFNPVILDKSNKSIVIQVTALRRDIDKL